MNKPWKQRCRCHLQNPLIAEWKRKKTPKYWRQPKNQLCQLPRPRREIYYPVQYSQGVILYEGFAVVQNGKDIFLIGCMWKTDWLKRGGGEHPLAWRCILETNTFHQSSSRFYISGRIFLPNGESRCMGTGGAFKEPFLVWEQSLKSSTLYTLFKNGASRRSVTRGEAEPPTQLLET